MKPVEYLCGEKSCKNQGQNHQQDEFEHKNLLGNEMFLLFADL